MLYIGIGAKNHGIIVEEDEALEYALLHCGLEIADNNAPDAEEFREMLKEWYFSGEWRRT